MADDRHIEILKQGATLWNRWREENPDTIPDLSRLAVSAGLMQWGELHGGPIDFRQADLSHARLNYATLDGALLQNANLCGANLIGVRLAGADLRDADLVDAYLGQADLKEALFDGAKLHKTDFTRAENLDPDQIKSAVFDSTTVFPEGFEPPDGASVVEASPSGADIASPSDDADVEFPNVEEGDGDQENPPISLSVSSGEDLGTEETIEAGDVEVDREEEVDDDEDASSASDDELVLGEDGPVLSGPLAELKQAELFPRAPLHTSAETFFNVEVDQAVDLDGGPTEDQEATEVAVSAGEKVPEDIVVRVDAVDQLDEALFVPASISSAQVQAPPPPPATAKRENEVDPGFSPRVIYREPSYAYPEQDSELLRVTAAPHVRRGETYAEPSKTRRQIMLLGSVWTLFFFCAGFVVLGAGLAYFVFFGDSLSRETRLSDTDSSMPARVAPPIKSAIEEENEVWEEALRRGEAGAFQAYLTRYPDGQHSFGARARLAALDQAKARVQRAEDMAWRQVFRSNRADVFGAYLGGRQMEHQQSVLNSSEGLNAPARLKAPAKAAVERLRLSGEDDTAWAQAQKRGDRAGFQAYLLQHAGGKYVAEARMWLATLAVENARKLALEGRAWKRALKEGNAEAFKAYLTVYPNGAYASEARRRLARDPLSR